MPSSPLDNMSPEQIDALREELANRANRNSTRTPPPAPSQTFGMRTHSARRTGPRQRYDPEAAAEARHRDRMRLAELRKTVLAQRETEAEAKRVKVQAAKERNQGNYPAGGYPQPTMSPVYGMSYRDSGVPEERRAYWKERGIDSPGLSLEEQSRIQGPTAKVKLPVGDRPISSMYSVTPNQYQDAYGVPFTGSDPDSMRRLLALQNGTASVIGSERKVMDQQSQDAFDNRPKNPNPPAFGGLAPITPEQELARKRGIADRARTDFEMQTGALLFDKGFDLMVRPEPTPEEIRWQRKYRDRVDERGGSSPPQTSANR